MTIFYVKTGGNGTFGTTDPIPTNWANVHPSYAAAMTAGAGDGDIIRASHLHTETDVTTLLNTGASNTARNPLQIMSVDDTDASASKEGAFITTTLSDLSWNNAGLWNLFVRQEGSGSDFRANTANMHLRMVAGKLIFTDPAMIIRMQVDGASARFIDVAFEYDNAADTNGVFQIQNGGELDWRGGSFTSIGAGDLLGLTVGGFVAGGATVLFDGTDLSAVTTFLINNAGATRNADDRMEVRFINCDIAVGVDVLDEALTAPNQHVSIFGTDDSSGALLERFQDIRHNGSAINEGSVHRTASDTLPDGNDLTIRVDTTADCFPGEPYELEMPAFYVDLSDSAKDVVTVHLTSDDALDDLEVQFALVYPDAAAPMTANVAAGFPQIVTNGFERDPLASATTLTTTTGLWTNGKTNTYKIELDTSGDAAVADSNIAPRLIMRFTGASQTIYIDPQVDLS